MYTNIWFMLFIASGAAMVVLLMLKALQEKLGLLLFWPHQRQIIEKKLARHVEKIQFALNHLNSRTFYIFLHYLLTKIRKMFSRIQSWLDQKSAYLVSNIRGKQRLDMRGKASHFLYDIRSFKDKFRRH